MLTREELYQLHTTLFCGLTAVHQRMLDRDGNALIPASGPDWAILRAIHAEGRETMDAVFAEITRRDREAVDA